MESRRRQAASAAVGEAETFVDIRLSRKHGASQRCVRAPPDVDASSSLPSIASRAFNPWCWAFRGGTHRALPGSLKPCAAVCDPRSRSRRAGSAPSRTARWRRASPFPSRASGLAPRQGGGVRCRYPRASPGGAAPSRPSPRGSGRRRVLLPVQDRDGERGFTVPGPGIHPAPPRRGAARRPPACWPCGAASCRSRR